MRLIAARPHRRPAPAHADPISTLKMEAIPAKTPIGNAIGAVKVGRGPSPVYLQVDRTAFEHSKPISHAGEPRGAPTL